MASDRSSRFLAPFPAPVGSPVWQSLQAFHQGLALAIFMALLTTAFDTSVAFAIGQPMRFSLTAVDPAGSQADVDGPVLPCATTAEGTQRILAQMLGEISVHEETVSRPPVPALPGQFPWAPPRSHRSSYRPC